METLLEVRNLTKTFRFREGLFHRHELQAVKPVSFNLQAGQTLAIIGANGSGSRHLHVCYQVLSSPLVAIFLSVGSTSNLVITVTVVNGFA